MSVPIALSEEHLVLWIEVKADASVLGPRRLSAIKRGSDRVRRTPLRTAIIMV